ncbi:PAS domain-containing protein [sulfur-oxidizing endosymbiont of Gigantopelta aegis]|uniref:PAS domain-containing protein n=1 Tax=sulfur-oxidizing endosymbiont of Gigantopelta aegis TaxID=2794934 RepID=UPI001FE8209B|nr:PAS domain-containing protein [sulfur-oxidizing endosymbiont of Gigantopelta aegis]
MGSISFLALEAIGATIAIHYGFQTAFWAILTASVIIFLTAIPISYHAARYNIDIDLITRSAGFGYVGSTITSLIYASFSFIFFALEAAIMAQALELYFGLPLAWGYLFSSLIIIPMVFYGITFINKLQMWTQPIWITMMLLPFIAVLLKEPEAITAMLGFTGSISESSEFNFYYFGFAIGISLSLIAQIGEQVDYLRFMPPLEKHNRFKWWAAMLLAGPGWIILGFLKQLGGIFLASVVLLAGLSLHEAKTPIQMYYIGYQYVFENPEVALAASTFFVIISQIKINVTNAYAGSLAWSNFFSRVTHSHPGRVVWMVFNIAIALLLMELGLFYMLEKVLGLYSNVAIAWIGAITADLIINKPLGLSPKIIEFKRAHLYSFNPVGVGSMGIASIVAIIAFMGFLGDMAQSYSALIAMFLAFILSPLFAWFSGGKYYIARSNDLYKDTHHRSPANAIVTHQCEMCDNEYEQEDMAYCSFHEVKICSLCCSLDSLCHDACKEKSEFSLRKKLAYWCHKLSAGQVSFKACLRLQDFISISFGLLFLLAVIAWMVYSAQLEVMSDDSIIYLEQAFITFFFLISIMVCTLVWWVLLLQESRELAENDLEQQNKALKESQEAILYQKQALDEQKELYELVFKKTMSGVLILDIESNQFIDCNESALKILRRGSKKEVLNLEPAQISPEFQPDGRKSDEKSYEMIALAVKNGSHTFEWKHLTKNNIDIWIEVTLTPIVIDGKQVLHTVFKDIEERKATEKNSMNKKIA